MRARPRDWVAGQAQQTRAEVRRLREVERPPGLLVRSAPSRWSPAYYGQVRCWWDAAQLSLGDGDPVTPWADLVQGWVMEGSFGGDLLYDAEAVGVTLGANRYGQVYQSFFNGGGPQTVMIVAAGSGGSGAQALIGCGELGQGTIGPYQRLDVAQGGGGASARMAYSDSDSGTDAPASELGPAPMQTGGRRIYWVRLVGTDLVAGDDQGQRMTGTRLARAVTGFGPSNARVTIGANPRSSGIGHNVIPQWAGTIHEIVCWDSDLAGDVLTGALHALAVKWGITPALPTAEGIDAAPSARQIIAGTGLTGGGLLSGDVTLAVAYGSSSGTAAQGDDARLNRLPNPAGQDDGLIPTTVSGAYTLAADVRTIDGADDVDATTKPSGRPALIWDPDEGQWVAGMPEPPLPPPTPAVFAYTGAAQTWLVPDEVTEVSAVLRAPSTSSSARGERRTGTFPVTPGEVLQVNCGGQPSGIVGGWNGGGNAPSSAAVGGAGATDIRRGTYSLAERIIVAGGAGGAGSHSGRGGHGGTDVGETGVGTGGGGGGTQSAGGAAGGGNGTPGTAGTLGQGGLGREGSASRRGGGGGGGYYGGGGGGANGGGATPYGSGGGGGSGWADGTVSAVTSERGEWNGPGEVVIYYQAPPAPPVREVTADDDITSADRNGLIEATDSAPIVLTIRDETTEPFAPQDTVTIWRGDGDVHIVPDAGVDVLAPGQSAPADNGIEITAVHGQAVLRYRGGDSWAASGALTIIP